MARFRRGPTSAVQVLALRPGRAVRLPDRLATEEPLQVRVQPAGAAPLDVAVTMRTPGHDRELAVGYLLGEGLIEVGDITAVVGCERPPGTMTSSARTGRAMTGSGMTGMASTGIATAGIATAGGGASGGGATGNVVTVGLDRPLRRSVPGREGAATSACGACGKTSVDDVVLRCPPVAPGPVVARSVVLDIPDRLRSAQALFARTGGVHAAGELTATGEVVAVREDVGRHNALDKVIGRAALAGRHPVEGRVLALSGRIAFELVQKAALAGFGVVVAVGAPSSLAVEAADRLGITLVGFVRGERANVYTHPERIDLGT